MTVEQLIEKLKTFDPDKRVYTTFWDEKGATDYFLAERVESMRMHHTNEDMVVIE